jgi:hypothetical protein
MQATSLHFLFIVDLYIKNNFNIANFAVTTVTEIRGFYIIFPRKRAKKIRQQF